MERDDRTTRAAVLGWLASWVELAGFAVPIWLRHKAAYGRFGGMKKTLHIDEALLSKARAASGASTDTETVRLGLEALVRHAAYERLRALLGSEPAADDVPRRREKPSRKTRAA